MHRPVRAAPSPAQLADLRERVGRALTKASTRISFLCESDGTVAWVSESKIRGGSST